MFAFNSYMRKNAYHHNLKCIFEGSLCCHVIVTQQRPIVEQFAPEFRNLPSVGKGADMSELQAHNCMLPKQ